VSAEVPVRVAFLGNDRWSVPSLEALARADDVAVAPVVTNPPRPAGRGSKLTPTPVAEAARRLALPLIEVERVRDGEGYAVLEEAEPDAIVVVAYGEILTADVLDIPRLGCVNVHFSLLPRWRGAAPVQHAIFAGDEKTGVTLMLMDEGLDTGPILAQREEPIREDDDAGTLGERLSVSGAGLLVETLPALAAGSVEPRSQDPVWATFAPKLRPGEREIDWSEPAGEIVRRVRALAPEPGASTRFRGETLKVFSVEALWYVLTRQPLPPGTLEEMSDGTPTVDTGSRGLLMLLEVAPSGRKRMTGAEWARGARLQPGERLG
jgi:methionyl-tRNA formyltransferase